MLLLVPASRASAVRALLFERGVEELRLPGGLEEAAPARTLVALAVRERELLDQAAHAELARAAQAERLAPALARARRAALASLARLEAAAVCAATGHAFVVWGWVPRAAVPALADSVARAFCGAVSLAEFPVGQGEEEAVPVVLANPAWLRPFQLLLALVPLPRHGSIDPTPWLALFYPLFFGFMLGDLGFGLGAVALALLARRRGWGGRLGRDVAAIALACGVSAAFFGILFGEAFGSLGEHIGLRPLAFDRRRGLVLFLGVALAAGLVHLAVGIALGIAHAARHHHRREALGGAARLGLLAGAAASAAGALGVLPAAAAAPGLVCAVGCAVVAVAAEGPLALLEVVLSLGNVLSYARLMALGIASVMLAEVANGIPAALPRIGSAGSGALAEKPELRGAIIVMLAIPETLVILGFVVAVLILLGKGW